MSKGHLTFFGGVHPDGNKDLSKGKGPIVFNDPKTITIPLHQHTGAPCESLVAKGDRVLEGQKIAESDAMLSAPIHASVSGTVDSIIDIESVSGRRCQAIVIENDFKHEKAYEKPAKSYEDLSVEELKEMIKDAGIVGMGGAGFPTHVKLSPSKDKNVDALIVNGSECEPYLTCDDTLMRNYPEEILKGVRVCMKILGVDQAYIAIEDNKPEAFKSINEKNNEKNIEVVQVKTKYPQGDEKRLIFAVLNRTVPSGGLPMDAGCVVINVATVKAIYDCVFLGKPLYERITTVTGSAVKEAKNLIMPMGTSIGDAIDAAGGLKEKAGKVISGGPMMGIAQYKLETPLEKTSGGILVLNEEEAKGPETTACINCARCVEVCPVGLEPLFIAQNAQAKNWDQCEDYHALDCIRCGSCAYICPARRPLLEMIKLSQQKIRSKASKSGGR